MTTPQTPQAQPCDFAVIGDSLVGGMRSHADAKKIALSGIGGATTGDWLLFAPELLARLRPKSVIIALGINDVSAGTGDAEFADSYRRLCALFRDAEAHVFVSTILPVERDKPWGDAILDIGLISRFNAIIAAIAAEKGYELIDSHGALAGPDGMMPHGLTTDGVHLSEEGYQRWKRALLRGAGLAPDAL